MDWRVWSVDTITGQKLNMLPCSAFAGERKLNSKGVGSLEMFLSRKLVDELDPKGITTEVDTTLVLERRVGMTYQPTYAGIVWERTWDRDAGKLSIKHEDLWSIFSKRFIVDSRTAAMAGTPVQILNVTMATLAKLIVQRMTDAGPTYSLPISYPANQSGGESRKFFGYHLPRGLEELQAVMDTDGGPDVDFVPRWSSAGTLEYVMRVGSLTSGIYEWNTASGRTGVKGITVTTNAQEKSSLMFGTGEGSEAKRLLRVAQSGVGVALESQEAFDKETDVNRLQVRTNAKQAANSSVVEQWGLNILAGGNNTGDPVVTDLQLGGKTRLHFSRDLWIPDGWHEQKLIGYSMDLSETVNLQVQPIGA